jgi:hypothetical protein
MMLYDASRNECGSVASRGSPDTRRDRKILEKSFDPPVGLGENLLSRTRGNCQPDLVAPSSFVLCILALGALVSRGPAHDCKCFTFCHISTLRQCVLGESEDSSKAVQIATRNHLVRAVRNSGCPEHDYL